MSRGAADTALYSTPVPARELGEKRPWSQAFTQGGKAISVFLGLHGYRGFLSTYMPCWTLQMEREHCLSIPGYQKSLACGNRHSLVWGALPTSAWGCSK